MSDESLERRAAVAPPRVLLRVSDLTVRFEGIVALDGVSFEVPAGQIAALIGPNGAGKTTLFNSLSRLYPCERGFVVFDGVDLLPVRRHDVARLGIGRTFQSPALFDSMTVLDNVRVGGQCRTRSGFAANILGLRCVAEEAAAITRRARELLDLLGLGGVAPHPVTSLPTAMRKRVELARALAGDPKLLLLDEPAAGLSREEVGVLGRLIRDLRDRLDITVLLVEHHMGLVMEVSDKVIALNFGRKIAEGAPVEVSRHADVKRAYLGMAP